jgi:hypothetical protein
MFASLNVLAFTAKPAHQRIYTQPAQKRKVNTTETSSLAAIVRRKLSIEAARPDYQLRIVVGHANLLDCMVHISAKVEQKEERRLKKLDSGFHTGEEEWHPQPEAINPG